MNIFAYFFAVGICNDAKKKRTRLISSHFERTSLFNKIVITEHKENIFSVAPHSADPRNLEQAR